MICIPTDPTSLRNAVRSSVAETPRPALARRRAPGPHVRLRRTTVVEPVRTVHRVPRRSTPDPLAKRIGARIRSLRKEAGLTLEKLAYESDLGSKGFLSDIETGLARPTVETLRAIAERLDVDLLDHVTFPGDSDRQRLVDRTRALTKGTLVKLLRATRT